MKCSCITVLNYNPHSWEILTAIYVENKYQIRYQKAQRKVQDEVRKQGVEVGFKAHLTIFMTLIYSWHIVHILWHVFLGWPEKDNPGSLLAPVMNLALDVFVANCVAFMWVKHIKCGASLILFSTSNQPLISVFFSIISKDLEFFYYQS